MSRDKNCREIMFVSQLSRNHPDRGGNLEMARDSPGGILGDNFNCLGEGNRETKMVPKVGSVGRQFL